MTESILFDDEMLGPNCDLSPGHSYALYMNCGDLSQLKALASNLSVLRIHHVQNETSESFLDGLDVLLQRLTVFSWHSFFNFNHKHRLPIIGTTLPQKKVLRTFFSCSFAILGISTRRNCWG